MKSQGRIGQDLAAAVPSLEQLDRGDRSVASVSGFAAGPTSAARAGEGGAGDGSESRVVFSSEAIQFV